MTRAERIIDEIIAQLQTIRPENGYHTYAGDNVFAYRTTFDDAQEKPLINITESSEDVQSKAGVIQLPGTKVISTISLIIEGVNISDPLDLKSRGHELIADLKTCLFNTSWSGDIQEMEYTGRSIGQHETGANLVVVSVNVDVKFIETLGNPEE